MKRPVIFFIILALGLAGCGWGTSDFDSAIMDGVSHLNLNKPEKALTDFNRAIDLEPGRASGYQGRANALNTLQRYRESLRNYDIAIELDPGPGLANAYVNRAVAYSHLGENKKAIADYEKGLELDPKIDNPPGFMKRLFSNEPNTDQGIRKHLEFLKAQEKDS
jgi:tetratricopeptide (TPR) repeat protein